MNVRRALKLFWLLFLLLVGLLLASGCRRLPGPAACQRVAAVLLGIDDARLLANPRVKNEFDQLTRDCLLTPFDSELVRCVDETKQSQKCVFEFKRRHESAERAVLEGERDLDSPVRHW